MEVMHRQPPLFDYFQFGYFGAGELDKIRPHLHNDQNDESQYNIQLPWSVGALPIFPTISDSNSNLEFDTALDSENTEKDSIKNESTFVEKESFKQANNHEENVKKTINDLNLVLSIPQYNKKNYQDKTEDIPQTILQNEQAHPPPPGLRKKAVPGSAMDTNHSSTVPNKVGFSWAAKLKSQSSPQNHDGTDSKVVLDKNIVYPVEHEHDSTHSLASSSNNSASIVKKPQISTDARKMGQRLDKYLVDNTKTFPVGQQYIPHGFKNPSQNNCFTNSVIQSLFACRPFVNLLRSLPEGDTDSIHYCLKNLLGKFRPWDKESKRTASRVLEENNNMPCTLPERYTQSYIATANESPNSQTSTNIAALDPFHVQPILKAANMDDGRQHDAQEFLSFLINSLNDEYVKVAKHFKVDQDQDAFDDNREHGNDTDDELIVPVDGKWKHGTGSLASKMKLSSESSDNWEPVQSTKSKRAVARMMPQQTHTTTADDSPISRMFNGKSTFMIEDIGERVGLKPKNRQVLSASTEPFLTLGLDLISSGKDKNEYISLYESLQALSEDDLLNDYQFQGKVIETTARKQQIQHFPPILILHLKRFAFNVQSGEYRKIHTDIPVPSQLDLPPELISRSSNAKIDSSTTNGINSASSSQSALNYQLFAIVYHHGQKIQTGHYTADVKVSGDRWCNCDDERITISQQRQKNNHGTKTPYLLMYMNENNIRK